MPEYVTHSKLWCDVSSLHRRKYIVQMMSYSSKTLPIKLCILYINIVIQCML